jgi:hypothetical protein
MAGVIAKYAMKKTLSKEMNKYKSKSADGPYVSTIPTLSIQMNLLPNAHVGSIL